MSVALLYLLSIVSIAKTMFWKPECDVDDFQPIRSAAWIRLNSSGIFTSSNRIGIKICRLRPSEASVLTQSEFTEAIDQSTTMQRAESMAASKT